MLESSIDEKALSERKSSKGFILPPIAKVNQEIKNLITEDVENGGQINPKNESQIFSEPFKTNYEKKEERMLL